MIFFIKNDSTYNKTKGFFFHSRCVNDQILIKVIIVCSYGMVYIYPYMEVFVALW